VTTPPSGPDVPPWRPVVPDPESPAPTPVSPLPPAQIPPTPIPPIPAPASPIPPTQIPPIPIPPVPAPVSPIPPTLPQPVRPPQVPVPGQQPIPPQGLPQTPPPRVATGATRVIPSGIPTPSSPFPGVSPAAPSSTGAEFPGSATPSPPGPPKDDDDGTSRPFFRRPLVLVGAGLLAASLIGGLVYYLFFRPEPIILDPEVVVIPLPTPTIDVVTIDNPTDFQAGLPDATLAYGLVAVEDVSSSERATWPERFAEGWGLTYDDGSGLTMTVTAIQHYHEDDAIAAFEALWTEANLAEGSAGASPSLSPSASPATLIERHPVMSGDTQVGESFKVVTEVTETVVGDDGVETPGLTREVAIITWRNATAVFVMTADPSVIDDLFLEYGV